MDTFAPEDRYALQGTRLAVERSRLPADVHGEFREWVLVGLFVRGRDAISDYFFDVLRAEGLEDIADESNVFGTFLAHEFDRYLDSEGARFAARFRHRPQPRRSAPEVPAARVAPATGPSLPPALVSRLRSLGLVLSPVEDAESGLWKREDPAPVAMAAPPSDGAPSTATATPRVLTPATNHSVDRHHPDDAGGYYSVPPDKLPAPVIVEGVDWGNPRVRFVGAAAVGLVSLGGTISGTEEARRKHRTYYAMRALPSRFPEPVRIAPPIRADRSSESDIPGGGHYGLRALVSDSSYHEALRALGSAPSLADVCNWIRVDLGRANPGKIDLVSSYQPTGGGPYPSRFWARRRHDAPLAAVDLLGNWRGKAAPLDDGPPDVW